MASIFYVLFFLFCSFFLFCDGLHWPCVNSGLDNIYKRPIKVNLLIDGTRRIGRPKLRYKDTYNSALKCGEVRDWCQLKVKKNRLQWRQLTRQTCKRINGKSYQKKKENKITQKIATDDVYIFFMSLKRSFHHFIMLRALSHQWVIF